MSNYDPKNAPVVKHGGNKPIHDGIVREKAPRPTKKGRSTVAKPS